MRAILIVIPLFQLTACNMVVTKAPMFAKADEVGAPRLRDGVWAGAPDSKCPYDPSSPIKTWPTCANGSVVGDDKLSGFNGEGDQRHWTSMAYVLAAGDPRVLQIHLTDLFGQTVPMADFFAYADLHPTKFDAQGRITEFETWFVLCGPPPPSQAASSDGQGGQKVLTGTLHPLPGLTMDEAKNNCTPASQDAVRNAAAASKAWDTDHSSTHWVRDGDQ